MKEFDLIQTYFASLTPPNPQLILGIGDDAAIWRPSPNKDLIMTVDTLHVNRHFLPECPPSSIAHKALAVNLSDCAAMGAKPLGYLLSLSMPNSDERWLDDFSRGLQAISNTYGVVLMGGDTTQGPLSVSITLIGEVDPGTAIRRRGATVGEDIYVSGSVGLASFGLMMLREHRHFPETIYDEIVQAYREPTPQVALGQALKGIASSCIDISDGLAADLKHILTESQVGASLVLEAIPMSKIVEEYADPEPALFCATAGGDDYQLIFTAPAEKRDVVLALSQQINIPLTRIGQITPGQELICRRSNGESVDLGRFGWEHFSNE
jgi:thiamine-monophosphate kinase